MGVADRLKGVRKKAEDTAAEHKDQLHSAVEKAEVAADQQTAGKYHDQIAKAGSKVDEYVENLKPDAPEAQDATGTPRETSVRSPEEGSDAP